MSKYKKFIAVVRHEYMTVVQQRSFWLSMLIIPAFFLFSFGIGYISSIDDGTRTPEATEGFDIAVIDNSSLISTGVTQEAGVDIAENRSQADAQDAVRRGELDGLIVYPEDYLETASYQVYVNLDDEDSEQDIEATASRLGSYLMVQSLLEPVGSSDAINAALSANSSQADVTSYEDGEESPGFAAVIVPGSFIVMFYIVFFLAVSYAMTSVSEEKENRAIEMVLSYVTPRTLITGKLLGVTLVALTQLIFYALFGLAAYLVMNNVGDGVNLPINLNELVFELQPILFGLFYFVLGFILYITLMLATGAAFPSAKEAGGFTGIFYLLVFIPYIAFEQIISMPDALLTQVATYFPLTAAPTLLLRNAAGNISLVDSLIGVAVLVLSIILAVWLAGRLFRLGNLKFNSRVKLTEIFRK